MDDEEDLEEEPETDHLEEWNCEFPERPSQPMPIPPLPVPAHNYSLRGRMYSVCCSAHQDACTCS